MGSHDCFLPSQLPTPSARRGQGPRPCLADLHIKAEGLPHPGSFRSAEHHQWRLFGLQMPFPNCLRGASPNGLNRSLGSRGGGVGVGRGRRQDCQGSQAPWWCSGALGAQNQGCRAKPPNSRCACFRLFIAPENARGPEKGLGRPAGHPALNMQGRLWRGREKRVVSSRRDGRRGPLEEQHRVTRGGQQRPRKTSHVNPENHLRDAPPWACVPELRNTLTSPSSCQVEEPPRRRWGFRQAGHSRPRERRAGRRWEMGGWGADRAPLPGLAADPSQMLRKWELPFSLHVGEAGASQG